MSAAEQRSWTSSDPDVLSVQTFPSGTPRLFRELLEEFEVAHTAQLEEVTSQYAGLQQQINEAREVMQREVDRLRNDVLGGQ